MRTPHSFWKSDITTFNGDIEGYKFYFLPSPEKGAWGSFLTLSSCRVKPRPARTLVWYRTVGQRTTGRSGPATGLGAMARAFFTRFCFLRNLRAGWLNQVLTNRCQSLWKCPFGIMLLPFGAMAMRA